MLDFPHRQQVWARLTPPLPAQAGPQEGRAGSHLYRPHTHRRVDPSSCLRHAPGLQSWGSKSGSFLSVSLSPETCPPGHPARAEPGSKPRRAESAPGFSWGLSNRDSPPVLSHSQRPERGLTCAPAGCSPASACSSGPHWSGCHSPVPSPFFPGSSPTMGGRGGVVKTSEAPGLRTWKPRGRRPGPPADYMKSSHVWWEDGVGMDVPM